MFYQCWANVVDDGPTLVKHWVDVSCLLGYLLAGKLGPRHVILSPWQRRCRQYLHNTWDSRVKGLIPSMGSRHSLGNNWNEYLSTHYHMSLSVSKRGHLSARRSEAEHATSRSRRLPTILTFTHGWGRNIFCFFETAETGNRTPNSGVKGSGYGKIQHSPQWITRVATEYQP